MEPASPQLEDGYTKIAHEVLEALSRCGVPASVFRLVLAVIRETYGYHEKQRRVTRARLATILGVSERRIRQLLKEAAKANMVTVSGWQIGFEKDWTKWPKAEGPPSAFMPSNRKEALPLCDGEPEGEPSALVLTPEDTNRKGALPPKPEGCPSAHYKDRKDRTSKAKALPTDAGKPRGGEHADLTNRAWKALELPDEVDPKAYPFVGARKQAKGLVILREWVTHIESRGWIERFDPTSDALTWFKDQFNYAMGCKPGFGWRREAAAPATAPAADGPDFSHLQGWPADPEKVTRADRDIIEAMAASPDYDKFPPFDEHFMGNLLLDIPIARKEFLKRQAAP